MAAKAALGVQRHGEKRREGGEDQLGAVAIAEPGCQQWDPGEDGNLARGIEAGADDAIGQA
jgi:hypothetical protein